MPGESFSISLLLLHNFPVNLNAFGDNLSFENESDRSALDFWLLEELVLENWNGDLFEVSELELLKRPGAPLFIVESCFNPSWFLH